MKRKDLRFNARGFACFRRDIITVGTKFSTLSPKLSFFCVLERLSNIFYLFFIDSFIFYLLSHIFSGKKLVPMCVCSLVLYSRLACIVVIIIMLLIHLWSSCCTQTDKLLKSFAFQINLKLAVTLKYNNNSNDNMNNHQWTIIVIFWYINSTIVVYERTNSLNK